jgi:hypothetical protein
MSAPIARMMPPIPLMRAARLRRRCQMWPPFGSKATLRPAKSPIVAKVLAVAIHIKGVAIHDFAI